MRRNLDEEITEDTIVEIAWIVTRSAAEEVVEGYRRKQVYVMGREDVVYRPPEAARVPEMMRALAAFIRESTLHPVLKACAAHFYLAYVHPFADGNGRTARALSYMISRADRTEASHILQGRRAAAGSGCLRDRGRQAALCESDLTKNAPFKIGRVSYADKEAVYMAIIATGSKTIIDLSDGKS